jgi:hypothetical protein
MKGLDKMTLHLKPGLAVVVAALSLLAVASTPAWALPNGGLESGDFSGWHQNSTGQGQWQVYSGGGFLGLAAPPQESFAAETVQDFPSSNVLSRTLRLKKGVDYRLKMQVYYVTDADHFDTPRTLVLNNTPNEQYRIDLMKPHSPLRSLKRKDVLMNLFRTDVGDPLTMAPKTISKDISRFGGHRVRLRLAEVDNHGKFAAGVDAVALKRG